MLQRTSLFPFPFPSAFLPITHSQLEPRIPLLFLHHVPIRSYLRSHVGPCLSLASPHALISDLGLSANQRSTAISDSVLSPLASFFIL